jgi:hypothetical protein
VSHFLYSYATDEICWPVVEFSVWMSVACRFTAIISATVIRDINQLAVEAAKC